MWVIFPDDHEHLVFDETKWVSVAVQVGELRVKQEIVDIAKRHQYTRYAKASGKFVDKMLADTPQYSFVNVLFYLNG